LVSEQVVRGAADEMKRPYEIIFVLQIRHRDIVVFIDVGSAILGGSRSRMRLPG
jgi:hypothetical protein